MCHLTETGHHSQDPSHLSCLSTANMQRQRSRSPFSFPHLHQVIDGHPVYEVQPLLIIIMSGGQGVLYLMDWQGYGLNEHSGVPRRYILDPLFVMDFSRLYPTELCKHQVEPLNLHPWLSPACHLLAWISASIDLCQFCMGFYLSSRIPLPASTQSSSQSRANFTSCVRSSSSFQNYVACALGIHFIGFVMMCSGATNALCSFIVGRLSQYMGRPVLFSIGIVTLFY